MAEKIKRITRDPKVMTGKPVVKGTRVTVESILERLGAGETIEQILEAHPQLEKEDVQEALTYASEWMSGEKIYEPGS